MTDFLDNYQRVIDACEQTYGDDFRALAWGTMIYACQGKRVPVTTMGALPCGFEHRVWLGLGVEGPPALKGRGLWVPAPFYCGRCPNCTGAVAHVRWHEDEEWEEPRPFERSVPRFLVPSRGKARRYARDNYGGANYVTYPTG